MSHRALLLLGVLACGGGESTAPSNPTPHAIAITSSSLNLTSLGETTELRATVLDQNDNPLVVTVAWQSTNQAVATVSAAGLVTATGNGSTTVSARAGNVSAQVTITVAQAVVAGTISPNAHQFSSAGETQPFTVSLTDARGNAMPLTAAAWSSSNPGVASVSATGVVSAVANGSAQITATSGPWSGSAAVVVNIQPASIRVTPATHTLNAVGASVSLSGTVVDALGTPIAGTSVTWLSEAPSVATVSANGTVVAVSAGIARIVASAHALSAAALITVSDLGDLGVGWIHRAPEMNYVVQSTNPTRDGWPAAGQTISWDAVLKNWSSFDRTGVPYRWLIDGVQVASGTVNMPARQFTTVSLSRTWSFDRARLKFELDPGNQFPEVMETNNTLEVFTDAISLGLYVEQSVYDYFATHQKKLGVNSNSWEDWAQRHVRIWNQMFADARFPLTPNGVLDRIRIDKITVVADGALPLAGGLPGNHPNLNDRTVDLQWGFESGLLDGTMYKNHTAIPDANGVPDNPFYFEGSLLHELGHARYLIDVYGFNIVDGSWTPNGIINKGSNVAIMEGGTLVAGSVHMPVVAWEHLYYTPMPGLMNSRYLHVDEYSAAALNRIAGRRAVAGNTNAPGNIGAFLNELPAENVLTVKGPSGVLAGASVKIYRASPKTNEWYGKFYDNTPDLSLTADAQGQVSLGANPFGVSIVHTYGHANGVLIVRVEHGGKIGFGFLEVWRFNMERWRGNTTVGRYELTFTLR
jgi:uncharacterized protein YjdB